MKSFIFPDAHTSTASSKRHVGNAQCADKFGPIDESSNLADLLHKNNYGYLPQDARYATLLHTVLTKCTIHIVVTCI